MSGIMACILCGFLSKVLYIKKNLLISLFAFVFPAFFSLKPVCMYVCVCVFFCLSSSASLLACGIRQASSQIYIAPDSLIGVERYSSSLAIENAPEDVQEYSWHRGANDTEENLIISYNATSHSRRDGPMYSGRESVSVRGTLRIRGSQLNDTGNYTVRVDTISDTQRAIGWLEILGELAAAPPPNCS